MLYICDQFKSLFKEYLIYKNIKASFSKNNTYKYLAIILALVFNPLKADESTPVFFFGDSDNDTGYFSATTGNCKAWTIPFSTCGAITGDGITTIGSGNHWVNTFGNYFGINTTSVNSTASTTSNKPTTNGGNNYAAGGARINQINDLAPGVWSLAQQVDRYLLDYGGTANKNAIYSFDVTNDVRFIDDAGTEGSLPGLKNYIRSDGWTAYSQLGITLGNQASFMGTFASYTELVTDYTNQAIKLTNAGARYVLLEMEMLSAPSSVDPSIIDRMYDPGHAMSSAIIISDTGTANLITYNKAVLSSMKQAGVNVIPYDDYSTTMHVIENYADYGFSAYGMSHVACASNASDLTGGWSAAECGASKHTGSGFLSDAEAYSAALNEFLFADSSHKAPAFLRIEADLKYNLIAAPVQIGMLSESSLQSRRRFHQDLQNQITKSVAKKRDANQRLDYWVDIRRANQNFDTNKIGFTDLESREFSGSVGMDYATSDGKFIFGGSLSYFDRKIDYSNNRGDYVQDEYTLSLYTAFNKNNYWWNAATSYGFIYNDIARKSPIGITAPSVKGDTKTDNFSLNISTGYNFEYKNSDFAIKHGPIIGLTYQNLKQDGFTESSTVSLVALSFEDYNTKSLESELGYQIQGEVGLFQPFARASLRHEFEDVENKITAAITSSSDYNQNYNIYMPVKNVNYKNYRVGTNININENSYASIYHETAYGGSEKIYQYLFANLNYSF